jgi:hypothetical protein
MLAPLEAVRDESSDEGLNLAPATEQVDDPSPSRSRALGDPQLLGRRKHAKLTRTMPALPDDIDAVSIPEFCRRHGISQSLYYDLNARKLGPRTMKVGGRTLISREAAAAWRRARERDAVKEQLRKERRRASPA